MTKCLFVDFEPVRRFTSQFVRRGREREPIEWQIFRHELVVYDCRWPQQRAQRFKQSAHSDWTKAGKLKVYIHAEGSNDEEFFVQEDILGACNCKKQ